MARIFVGRTAGTYRIALQGRLSGGDLKRLERACGQALEYKRMPLELNLDKVSHMDDAARYFLERLRARGARILTNRAPPDVADSGRG